MERTEYVKQQGILIPFLDYTEYILDTLIVWTIKQTTDMALSFQEGQGCSEIMYLLHPNIMLIECRNFINIVRDPKATEEGDDEFIDEVIHHVALPVSLPIPALGNLDAIDNMVQQSVMTPAGRESLVSFIHEEVRRPTNSG
jgi:protein phosphatase-4 regulatory subunit 3